MPIGQVLESLKSYEQILSVVGLELDRSSVREHTTRGLGYRGPMKTFFSESHAAKHPTHTAPAKIKANLDNLVQDATDLIRAKLNGTLSKARRNPDVDAIRGAVDKLPDLSRKGIVQAVMKSKHGELIRVPEIRIEKFQCLLSHYAQGQTLARTALINHIQKEFKKRGITMSFDTIEERFRTTTTVKTMPACIGEIMNNLDGRFRTGLIPIESLCGDQPPKAWLGERQSRYFFKSASAMHQALSQATGLHYDSIHKALGSKVVARRIQKDVKDCFDRWEALHAKGQALDVAEKYRGVPVAQLKPLFDRLRHRYGVNGQLKNALATAIGVSPSWLQRYMTSSPRVKHMPMAYYTKLLEIADAPLPGAGQSYIGDEKTREIAKTLCQRANNALDASRKAAKPDKPLIRYKQLRRQLIEVLKQRRATPNLDDESDATP